LVATDIHHAPVVIHIYLILLPDTYRVYRIASQCGAVEMMIDSRNPKGVSGTHIRVYMCGIT
tara:strand:+ start:986 stop:1171 length:186 start_codon:yes stop_codon:yes gene_type:complete